MLSVFDQGPPPPCPAPFNMAAYVLAHAESQPDKIALSVVSPTRSERWSYGRLRDAVLGTGAGLLARGLRPGDRVVMRLGNSVEFPIAYLGAIAVGIVPVPTSAMLTAGEVARIVDDIAPGAILRDPEIASPDAPGVPEIGLERLVAMRDLPGAPYAMGDPEREAYIVQTSGTAGRPRAVAHAHRAIWARRMMHDGWYGIGGQDRLCHAGAFNWTYTLGTGLMDPWSVGASALIPAPGVEIAALPLLLRRHQATIFAAAPGVYRKILAAQNEILLPDLRHGLSAGEKLSDAIREGWHKATGTAIYEAFGMSECSTFISASPEAPAPAHSLGRPQAGRRVAIVDDAGPVEIGTEGVIAVSSRDPGLMLGYVGAETETRARFAGEWFLTGDLGQMDADFNITYKGRADDMMNAGGYRVSPLEVEHALSRFPGIGAVGVAEVEVKRDARVIAAFYTAEETIDEAALAGFAAANLARYKQPRIWRRLDTLPTGPNGKLSRRALRALMED
ncbi:Acyl-CoA synthetase (AMP-forming)/AMP-acid ligase II [Salinihabitans flavidus]|uniref:Acyl-CoA synthetase (AMP-forming)/AMP-acid ligase II n=1 Tax=Salinihabitans flavidus TaxID=569882 RepID=A0A1H8NHV9_9RHOB|nr:class I adenylate-forming enzyme family protein [Salinihabitans flavidus]SEO29210.1 Acyl-CoA synthetase (AMP-forming)/AMP-acid ligase II [Salinihabitans flavidus]